MANSLLLFDELECGLCFDRLFENDPRSLPCNHKFCFVCLIGLKSDKDDRSNTFTCPRCNKQHVWPLNGPNGFPTCLNSDTSDSASKRSVSNASSRAQSQTTLRRSEDRVNHWLTLNLPSSRRDKESLDTTSTVYLNSNKESSTVLSPRAISIHGVLCGKLIDGMLNHNINECKKDDSRQLPKISLTNKQVNFLNHCNVAYENVRKEIRRNKERLTDDISKKLHMCITEVESLVTKLWDGTINRRQARQKLSLLERKHFVLIPLRNVEIARFKRNDSENSIFDSFIMAKERNENSFEENVKLYKAIVKGNFEKFLSEIEQNFKDLIKQLELNKRKLDNEIIQKIMNGGQNNFEYQFVPILDLQIGRFKRVTILESRRNFMQSLSETMSRC
ncbi:unnamed protein product [Dimorphilus gyrociliatus]|uniref:RING-type domain-containing protein n=1 Tax=Dimorphilus gyrociliatus TaxID=2664684 RepID=A0A7I8W8Z9_9ANNE|nr:unnamed protein product [Dimorphilus gyrociliatus]